MNAVIVLVVILFGGIVLGFPIVWAMLGSCIAAIMVSPELMLQTVPQKLYVGMDSFAMLAVPCFMLCGDIMSKGGLSKRLCDFCSSLIGWIKGGLSIVAIAACAFFAAISGSALATTAAIGGIMHPEMTKKGYPSEYSSAVPTVAGTLGIVIPPSIPMVIYGNMTGVSVAKLMMAGIVPGIVCALALCLYAYFVARARKFPTDAKFSIRTCAHATKSAILAILMPVIILGGIYLGICTPTESAAIACFYGGVVCLVIYHNIPLKSFWSMLEKTAVSVSSLMLLVASATVMGFILTFYNVPSIIAEFFLKYVSNWIGFVLISIFIMLIAGMFMSVAANNAILAPIFAPIAAMYGMDPLHFGIIFIFLLAIGQATPPFGTCLFVGCAINNDPYTKVVKESLPLLAVELGCILLFTFVPGFSTFLPALMK